MTVQTITLDIPEQIYQRLENTALAMRRSVEEVILHTLKVGSPPVWDDVPAEYQTELAMMDRLEDNALWQIARSYKQHDEMERYDDLLARNQDGLLSTDEQIELQSLRQEAELFMLRKAHAAALLTWRGHTVPRS
ncbi:hypothetical protein KFU94_42170 [Chloroflexi bacterium TSY]|nr:hypothetical protein [Chloroflexi bacterium TSY]